MFRLLCLCALVLLVQGQRSAKSARYTDDPRQAAILSEERYLSGDGTFGAAYTQEDGVDFKEESDANGDRRGSYSYVDPSGQRRTISYTAGKNGFVATGDHLPVGPAAPAQPAQQAPQPRYNPAPQQQVQQSSRGIPNEDDGQYYPELYDNDNSPVRAQPKYQAAPAPQQPQYRPAPQQQQYSGAQEQQYAPAPQPQYKPAPQPQYRPAPQQQQYSGVQQQQAYVAPKVAPQYNTAPQQFSGAQQSAPAPRQQQYVQEERTEQPSRFFPPGKLDLNRSPDGYSYSFSSKF